MQSAVGSGFVGYGALGLLAAFPQHRAMADERQATQPYVISNRGCGRATGYAESNKIITFGRHTHVAWLDSLPEGFRVRIRSLDHVTNRWSRPYTLGSAHDNHGGPALTIDRQGYLHVVYYPHHHAMRYRRSVRPNDISEWTSESEFGERLTYPTLICGADGTLYCSARRSFSERPWEVELWSKTPDSEWKKQSVVLRSRFGGYAHFQESLVWGRDHRTLHLACRFHERTDSSGYGRLQGIAYLFSRDLGQTWLQVDGKQVDTPASADALALLATGGVDHSRILRVGGMCVDAKGRPQIVYSSAEGDRHELILATPSAGAWERRELSQFLPDPWSQWSLTAPAGVTCTKAGELVVTAQVFLPDEKSSWGHPSTEVVAFTSNDHGENFDFQLLSRPSANDSQWLPNLERPTGHNQVPANPGVLYTSGPPGSKNTELLSNRVMFSTVAASTRATRT